ncbi:MAG: hypothetical protein HY906_13725 [Deltaproteobacteria bacterium]|nr:hypothetical protein [Deltaproteobacteria bacterium]
MLDARTAGRSAEEQRQRELLTRAWTLLLQVYGEVAGTGRWLERHEDSATLYPSLWAMGRKGRPRKARPAAPAAPAPATPPTPGAPPPPA